MLLPGANSLRNEALLENPDTPSDFVVLPTLMALEIHAGKEIPSVNPLFPEAMTVAIFNPLSWSMTSFRGSESQAVVLFPPPMLILIEEILSLIRIREGYNMLKAFNLVRCKTQDTWRGSLASTGT